ncbi:MAG: hypothetical protein J6S14_15440 [Clostridia bacterium]|nr:hypothetical protein [Clostridia bacterium]
MIKLERTSVMNLDNAIRGMRNPMNSWAKSDSEYKTPCTALGPEEEPHWCNLCGYDQCGIPAEPIFVIGENDMKLAKTLINGGSDDRKFLRQIFVSVDITAPLYWWKEADTYKVATTANSCSTMHKIHAKEFTPADFSHENLTPRSMQVLNATIEELNFWRDIFNNGGAAEDLFGSPVIYEPNDKTAWLQMIELLPTSYNQMRTWTGNYENLLNMYYARRNHKLQEWKDMCDWILTLPYTREFFLKEET